MPDTPIPIPSLPAAGSLTGSEDVPIDQAGVTSRTTTAAIAALAVAGNGNAVLPYGTLARISNNTSTYTQAFTGLVTAGDMIVVVCVYANGYSLTLPTGYTRAAGGPYTNNGYTIDIMSRVATDSSGDTWVGTVSGGSGNTYFIPYWFLLANAGAISAPAAAATTPAGPTQYAHLPAITPTTGSLVFGVFVNQNEGAGGNPYPPGSALPPGYTYHYSAITSDANVVIFTGIAWAAKPISLGFVCNTNAAGNAASFYVPHS
jgi:hypothetical protein